MLGNKQELIDILSKECESLTLDLKKRNTVVLYLESTHNIPRSVSYDLIDHRLSLSDISDFLLFCLVEAIGKQKGNNYLQKYFVDIEISEYSSAKYSSDTEIDFPIIIKCVQVSHDQWIGIIDINLLMKFRKAQLITYNANTQRTLQRIVRGEKETYKIALNKSAVAEIRESLHSDQFIPNTLTLNIPADKRSSFSYDSKQGLLIINDIQSFDITDGYHRFIAICQEKDSNPEYNYVMELRITNFTEQKAKQFIFQEDQKTQMKKTDSNSLNIYRKGNIVAERLNQDPTFNFTGMISRNEGVIPAGIFSDLIEYYWFGRKNSNKRDDNSYIISTTQTIKNTLNGISNLKPELLNGRMKFKELAIILYMAHSEEFSDSYEFILKVLESDKWNNVVFNGGIRKGVVKEIERIIREES